MVTNTTVARPYAKAIFEFAVEKNNIDNWQNMLEFTTKMVKNKIINSFLSGILSPINLASFFIKICDDQLDNYMKNLINIIAARNRLKLIPDILQHFIMFKNNYANIINVDVISAQCLTNNQIITITAALEKKFLKKIILNCKIDKSILAGLIIRIGDTTINGSIRNRLDRLEKILLY